MATVGFPSWRRSYGAVQILDQLNKNSQLKIKASSRLFMAAAGSDEESPALGHLLQPNGSVLVHVGAELRGQCGELSGQMWARLQPRACRLERSLPFSSALSFPSWTSDAQGGHLSSKSLLKLIDCSEKWLRYPSVFQGFRASLLRRMCADGGEWLQLIAGKLAYGVTGGSIALWHGGITWNDLVMRDFGPPKRSTTWITTGSAGAELCLGELRAQQGAQARELTLAVCT